MDFKQFRASLEAPEPVYLIKGADELLRRKALEMCRDQVDPEARDFDWDVFELPSQPMADVLSTARTLPWASPRRWVYLRNAQEAGVELAAYLKDPSPRTVLVMEASRLGKGWPKGLTKVDLGANLPASRWLAGKVKAEGYVIDADASRALSELTGEDLTRLNVELEKQFLLCMESRRITLDSVMELAQEARQYDIFALIGGIAQGREADSLRILGRLFDGGAAAPAVLSMLYWNFRRLLAARELLDRRVPFNQVLRELKVWSYKGREKQVRSYPPQRLKGILLRLRETDKMLKSTDVDPRIQMERLIVDTCRPSSV